MKRFDLVPGTELHTLEIPGTVVEPGLQSDEPTADDVHEAILIASETAVDQIDNPRLEARRVATQLVDHTQVEAGQVLVDAGNHVEPDSPDGGLLIVDLQRMQERDLYRFVVRVAEAREEGDEQANNGQVSCRP